MAIEQFPISPVPVQGRAAPFQLPQRFDPAQIIMHAAQLQQQRQLADQELQQRYMQNFMQSVQAAAALQEHKRESLQQEAMSEATLQMSQAKAPLEQSLLKAHANYLQSQANMMNDPDAANRLFALTQPGPNGEPPKMSYEQYMMAAPRGMAKMAFAAAAAKNPNANMMTGTQALAGQKAAAVTQESPSIQMPVRMANATLPSINLLDRLSDALPRLDVQLFNRGGIAAMRLGGSVAAQALATQTNNFVQAYNQQFGRGTDKKIDADFDALNSAQTQAQFKMSIALTKADIISKRNAVLNAGPNYTSIYDNAVAPMPKHTSMEYLQSLDSNNYSHDEAVRSLRTAREAGLIQD